MHGSKARQPPEGEPDAGDRAGLFGCGGQWCGLGGAATDRLLGQHVLAGRQDGGEYLCVRAVGERDADGVDAGIIQHGLQVRRCRAVAVAVRRLLGEVDVGVDDDGQLDVDVIQAGGHRHVAPSEGVGLSCRAGADQCDAQRPSSSHVTSLSLIWSVPNAKCSAHHKVLSTGSVEAFRRDHLLTTDYRGGADRTGTGVQVVGWPA